MAEIRPFRGLRYDENVAGNLADLITPPYDVIYAAAQQRYYERNPYNVIRLELGKQHLADNAADNRYTRADQHLSDWLSRGVLRAESGPAVYTYQQAYDHQGSRLTRTGVLAMLRLEEWEKGIVLPHETTMAGPKADRLELLKATRCNLSPVFGLYDDSRSAAGEALRRVTATTPTASFIEEREEHRLWAVSDANTIDTLQATLSAGPLFIADGHHRYETALYYRNLQRSTLQHWTGDEPWNFVLMLVVAVQDPGLLVLPTHRLLNPRVDREQLTEAIAQHFLVEHSAHTEMGQVLAQLAEHAGRRHAFAIYGLQPGSFTFLVSKDDAALDAIMAQDRALSWRQLDVSVLHEVVLRQGMGLEDADWSDEARVAYSRDERYATQAVDSLKYQLAILLNPTPVPQVLAVARDREVMPPKSTYFHPKPVTGLVMARLDR